MLYNRDDLRRHLGRYGRTSKCGTHDAVFMQNSKAHIISAMDHDASPARIVVEPLVNAVNAQ